MTVRGEPLKWLKEVNHGEECTLWPYSLTRGGYGQVYYQGRVRKAHQISFLIHSGGEAIGMVLHSCDNPPCVNPSHLRDGTARDNMEDCLARNRVPRKLERSNGRVSPSMAREIRESDETGRAISRRLNLSEGLISEIRSGKKHA